MTGEAFLCGTASVNTGSGAGVTSLVLTTDRSKPAGQRGFLFIAWDDQKAGSPGSIAGWTGLASGNTTGAAGASLGAVEAWYKDEALPSGTVITFNFNQSVKWAYAFLVYCDAVRTTNLDATSSVAWFGTLPDIPNGCYNANWVLGAHDAKVTFLSCLLAVEDIVDNEGYDPRFVSPWTELGFSDDDYFIYAGGEGGIAGLAGLNIFPHLTFGWREITANELVTSTVGPGYSGTFFGQWAQVTVIHRNYTPESLGSGCGDAVGIGDECAKTAGIGTGDECALTAGIGSGDECAKTDGVTVYTGVCE